MFWGVVGWLGSSVRPPPAREVGGPRHFGGAFRLPPPTPLGAPPTHTMSALVPTLRLRPAHPDSPDFTPIFTAGCHRAPKPCGFTPNITLHEVGGSFPGGPASSRGEGGDFRVT